MNKLLAISTDDALLATLWNYLPQAEVELIVANSGWTGLQIVRAEHPDVILCSLDVPGLDGFEVLQAVRGNTRTAHTPFILVSNQTALESRCLAIALGADDYLTQPLRLDHLLLAIQIQFNSQKSPEVQASYK